MKVIDLLNKIANGEEVPTEIKYNNAHYFWCEQCKIYERLEDDKIDLYNDLDNLNDKVEILEEKKIPEKLKWNEKSQHNVVTDNTKKTLEHLLSRSEQLKKIINEIIDYLDYLKSKGE